MEVSALYNATKKCFYNLYVAVDTEVEMELVDGTINPEVENTFSYAIHTSLEGSSGEEEVGTFFGDWFSLSTIVDGSRPSIFCGDYPDNPDFSSVLHDIKNGDQVMVFDFSSPEFDEFENDMHNMESL